MKKEVFWRAEKVVTKALLFGLAATAGLHGEPRFSNKSQVVELDHAPYRCVVYDQNLGSNRVTRTTLELPRDIRPGELCLPFKPESLIEEK